MDDKKTLLEEEDWGDYGNPEYTNFFAPHPEKPYQEYLHTKMPFTIKNISSKRWLNVCYNMLFMGLIQHYTTFGLMLDEMDIYYLKTTTAKIQEKLFVKDHGPFLEETTFYMGVGESQKVMFNRESLQKEILEAELNDTQNKNSLVLNLSENEIKNTKRFINDYDEESQAQINQGHTWSMGSCRKF